MELKAKIKMGAVVRNLTADTEINDYLRDLEDSYVAGRHRYYEDIEGAFVWKMPAFDLRESDIDELVDKAKKRNALILDLRSNSGGSVKTLARLVGNFFDQDIKIFEAKERKTSKPEVAKARSKSPFTGKLIVFDRQRVSISVRAVRSNGATREEGRSDRRSVTRRGNEIATV